MKFTKGWHLRNDNEMIADRNEIQNQVVTGSIQSCYRPQRLAMLKEQGFDLLMIDEAHHSVADSYQSIINELGFNQNDRSKLLIGVTATPDRAGLGSVFDKITFSRSIGTMIKAGYLSPVTGRKILTNLVLNRIQINKGDFCISELSELVNTTDRNNFIVEKFKEYALERKTVAFCCDVQHCKDLSDAFKAHGLRAAAVWGDMPHIERERALSSLKSGRIQVITSCGILTEGYDEPTINAIIMARPTRSRSLYIQCVGRGLRLYPSKQDCLVLDFSDKHHNLDGIMSLTSTIPEAEIKENNAPKIEREEIDMRPKIEVLSDCDKEFDILGSTRFIWVQVGDEWSLQDDEKNEIIMKPEESGFTAILYFHIGTSQKIVKEPLPLEYCSGVCEDFARRNLKIAFADQNKPWMAADAAPTQGQSDFLSKNRISINGMTRGQDSIEIRKIVAAKNKQRRDLSDEPMSDKQRLFLINRGFDTSKMTKLTAMQTIGKIKSEQVKCG